MKRLITILIFIFINSSFSQQKLNCFQDVFNEEIDNDLKIVINGIETKFIEPKEIFAFSSCKISIECNYYYLNLIYTFKNGNNYKTLNNIFKFKNGFFSLINVYTNYYDRYQTSFTGFYCNNILLNDYSIKSDLLDKKFIEKEISLISGQQDGKEIEEISYYKLIKKTFYSKKFKDVKLFTNEFVIDELGIESILSVNQFNNVAFFAFKSKAYEESIYILIKIIEKFPNRIVAYLNIADNYWALNEKEKAVENYKKYIQLIKDQKKDLKKIPKYVYERIK